MKTLIFIALLITNMHLYGMEKPVFQSLLRVYGESFKKFVVTPSPEGLAIYLSQKIYHEMKKLNNNTCLATQELNLYGISGYKSLPVCEETFDSEVVQKLHAAQESLLRLDGMLQDLKDLDMEMENTVKSRT